MSESESNLPVPAKNLDDYIADPFNQCIHQDLEEFHFDPAKSLAFFEWFYDLAALIEKGKPSAVLQKLDAIKCEGPLRLWFVYHLRSKFREPLTDAFASTPLELPPAFHVIDKEYERLEQLYPPDLFPSDDSLHGRASSAVARGKMVSDMLIKMLQKTFKEADEKRAHELQIRQDEREKLEQQYAAIVRDVLASVKAPSTNAEFTTNRQVIALCYLLKSAGAAANSSEQARFIEFLTNKNQKEIYKRVLAINDTVFNLEGTDAIYVQNWFTKLGLTGLANEINEILDRPSEKL